MCAAEPPTETATTTTPDLSQYDADTLRSIAIQLYKRIAALEDELTQVRQELRDLKAKNNHDMQSAITSNQQQMGETVTDKPSDFSQDSIFFIKVGAGELRVRVDSPIVYLPANGKVVFYKFLTHLFKDSSGVQQDKAGFYKIQGTAEQIEITSNNQDILEIGTHDQLGTAFSFKSQGDVKLIIELAHTRYEIPLHVVELVVDQGAPASIVIETYGMPDEEELVFCSWPDTKTKDNVIYSPSAQTGAIAAKHWRYTKFPNLVVSIVDNRIYSISSYMKRNAIKDAEALMRWGEGKWP